MKHNTMLTVASLLSLLFLTLHITDDIQAHLIDDMKGEPPVRPVEHQIERAARGDGEQNRGERQLEPRPGLLVHDPPPADVGMRRK